MADLVVIVPSRGRPEAAGELAQAFVETCTADTWLMFAVDGDDPTRAEYEALRDREQAAGRSIAVTTVTGGRSMVDTLNGAAKWLADAAHPGVPFAVGFQGDDHRPRTKGWDAAYLAALRDLGTGIVYGNDLLQGENLPTQCAMTADIVRALGYMAPPGLRHMYVDNFWATLGTEAACLRYLPDVVVEHLHPAAGKAEWDAGYRRVNARHMYDQDRNEFNRYCRHELAGAVEKVRALRAGVVA